MPGRAASGSPGSPSSVGLKPGPDERSPIRWRILGLRETRRVALMALTLLPAVDVADGSAVRLVQGEAGSETSYGDPLEAALTWQRDGAEWIHLVDLDAAFGRGSNRELIAKVVRAVDVAVELSGGIRDDDSLDAALATGATRVNIGTAALENPDWVRRAIDRVGERIAVGLDVRGTTLAARGWTQEGGELFDVLARLDADGCARYVVTDVRRDGTLTGPNVELLRSVTAATDRPVVASGGVSSLADLTAIAAVPGVEGAIVGKALYAGAFTLPEALAVAGGAAAPPRGQER
ncbi:phosphoribosylformimino-5-aminoimidazole carboxamide ribotide isomerase [Frankia canadensis]|uniref:1-(5-phosphoribosyl)-5-[(5-phosphoribosylamino)methylideneamino] imidazole-4-carboxamide isomerase n=2 Tax=Frankia canadensis TaxID=1836972 RepID=A0A2I2KRG1_9ACTN|nr:phosphoribosylformimino-5-aminoimidazole carboxamide ribotide isomerase [Frankia canadensis]SOU55530.1 phosphoribosylformimino-5-aminoimidazole carboxamide ribotide isomerase [Frankia canadensis]